MNDSLSDSEFLTCGIPQGTTLGPLLFILYINDLPNYLSNTVARMYDDDTYSEPLPAITLKLSVIL